MLISFHGGIFQQQNSRQGCHQSRTRVTKFAESRLEPQYHRYLNASHFIFHLSVITASAALNRAQLVLDASRHAERARASVAGYLQTLSLAGDVGAAYDSVKTLATSAAASAERASENASAAMAAVERKRAEEMQENVNAIKTSARVAHKTSSKSVLDCLTASKAAAAAAREAKDLARAAANPISAAAAQTRAKQVEIFSGGFVFLRFFFVRKAAVLAETAEKAAQDAEDALRIAQEVWRWKFNFFQNDYDTRGGPYRQPKAQSRNTHLMKLFLFRFWMRHKRRPLR